MSRRRTAALRRTGSYALVDLFTRYQVTKNFFRTGKHQQPVR